MHQKNHLKKLCILIAMCGTIASCASVSLEPGAEKVNLAVGSVPKGCDLRGNVNSGTQEAPITSHQEVQGMQATILKNQAAKLGANVVFIKTHKTTYYGHYIVSTGDVVNEVDTHGMSGQAYYCDAQATNKLSRNNTAATSDVRSGER